MGFKYFSNIEVAHGMIGIIPSVLLMMLNPYIWMQIKEYPVFKPNEYFWEHHWQKDKEEKWEAYARVIKNIIAQSFDIKISEFTIEDKMVYKKTLYGDKKKRET